jgi:hypothetical protein
MIEKGIVVQCCMETDEGEWYCAVLLRQLKVLCGFVVQYWTTDGGEWYCCTVLYS